VQNEGHTESRASDEWEQIHTMARGQAPPYSDNLMNEGWEWQS
jgi:hypothetical protein